MFKRNGYKKIQRYKQILIIKGISQCLKLKAVNKWLKHKGILPGDAALLFLTGMCEYTIEGKDSL